MPQSSFTYDPAEVAAANASVAPANQPVAQDTENSFKYDPAEVAAANAYGADPVNQQADQIANYKAANGADAFALGVNNTFENFGRGVLKKAYEVGDAMGMDNNDKINNLNKLYQATQTQEENTAQTHPIANTAGQMAGGAAIAAPIMASTAGLGGTGLAGLATQGAISGGAQAGLGDMTGNTLQATGIGAGLGAVGGAAGSVVGSGITKLANMRAGVLSEAGQNAADTLAATGVQKPFVAGSGWAAGKIFEATNDLPLSGTETTVHKLVGGIQSNVQDQLDTYSNAFKQDFGDDLTNVVKTAADPQGKNSFAAQALLKSISDDKDWTGVVANSGKLTQYYQQASYDQAKNDLLQKANFMNAIPVSDLHSVIDNTLKSATNKLTGEPLTQYSPQTISTLSGLKSDLSAMADSGGSIKFSDLDNVQGTMANILNKMYGANNVFGNADASLVNGVKKSFDTIQENALQGNPQLYNQLRDLKSTQFNKLETMKSGLFANLINNTTNPNDAAQTIFNRALVSKDVAQQLFNNLDPVGRDAVKYGFAQKLYAGMGENSDFGTAAKAMTNPQLRNSLAKNNDFIHTFFTPEEFSHITGSINAAKYLDNYASAMSNSPTGRIASSGGKLMTIGAGLATHPAYTGATLVGGTFFNRLMNSNAGPWLNAASKIMPNSPAYASLMEKIVNDLPQGVAQNNVNTIMPATSQQ